PNYVRCMVVGATVAALSMVFGILPEYWNPDQGDTLYNTVYTAIFRTVFSAAIACLIAVCVFGETKEGSFMTAPIWSILAKLTYWAYLVH
uniref:Uncharacterized protein n=1 Tax=Plectus sambesii TaxID=2011161 RepID=A0A914VHR7_9BILA